MKRATGFLKSAFLVVGGSMLMTSCFLSSGGRPTSSQPGALSTSTGLAYNDEDNNGFEVNPYAGQPEGPNLVFIEGGRSIVGSFEEDILNRRDNIERTVSVASFYMDETEIANIHWLEYLLYLNVYRIPRFGKHV